MAVNGNGVSQNAVRAKNAAVDVIAELLASSETIETRLLHERLQAATATMTAWYSNTVVLPRMLL